MSSPSLDNWQDNKKIIKNSFIPRVFKFTCSHSCLVPLILFSIFQRICPPWSWSGCRSVWSGGRLCCRYCRWRRCSRHSSAAKIVRRHDPYSYFRRGLGSVRTYCCHLHDLQPLIPMLLLLPNKVLLCM